MTQPLFATALLASALLAASALPAQAQQVYRIVGPDGKVTFSDRAPDAKTPPAQVGGGRATGPALPYELQQVATRFPVTLYTGNDCTPCVSARNLLMNRGVPFSERTVNTEEDAEALKRLSGSTSLPFGTIGSQQLIGFADSEWTQYLDAAGYPKQSALPPSYRRAPPSPLVAAKPAVPAAAATPAAPAAEAPRPAAPTGNDGRTPSNPAGISF